MILNKSNDIKHPGVFSMIIQLTHSVIHDMLLVQRCSQNITISQKVQKIDLHYQSKNMPAFQKAGKCFNKEQNKNKLSLLICLHVIYELRPRRVESIQWINLKLLSTLSQIYAKYRRYIIMIYFVSGFTCYYLAIFCS